MDINKIKGHEFIICDFSRKTVYYCEACNTILIKTKKEIVIINGHIIDESLPTCDECIIKGIVE